MRAITYFRTMYRAQWGSPSATPTVSSFMRSYCTKLSAEGLKSAVVVTAVDTLAQARLLNFLKRTQLQRAPEEPLDEAHVFKIERLSVDGQDMYRAYVNVPTESRGVQQGVGYAPAAREACHLAAMHAERKLDSLGIAVCALSKAQTNYAERKREAGLWAPTSEDTTPPAGISVPPSLRTGIDEGSQEAYRHFVVVRHTEFFGNKYALMSPVCLDYFAKDRLKVFCRNHGVEKFANIVTVKSITITIGNSEAGAPIKKSMAHVKVFIPLPKEFGERFAEGVAENKEIALILACMHGELLIDALGVKLFNDEKMQKRHARVCELYGRGAPYPTDPLAPGTTPSPPPLRVRFGNENLGDPSQLIDSYLEDYGPASRDLHSEDVEKVDWSCLVNLDKYLQQNGVGMYENYLIKRVGVGASTTFRAMIVLPLPTQFGKRFGIGIGKTPARARYIAAMHAVRVLDTLGVRLFPSDDVAQKAHAAATKRDGRTAPMPGSPFADPSTPSPPALRVSSNVQTLPNDVKLSPGEVEEEERTAREAKDKDVSELYDAMPQPQQPGHGESLAEDYEGYILMPPEEEISATATNLHTLVSPRKFDPGAVPRVEDYTIRHGLTPEVTVKDVGDLSSYSFFRVTMPLPVPRQFGERIACGESTTVKEATILCHMHAEIILDTLGIPLYDNVIVQRKHATAARGNGRWAPLPEDKLREGDTRSPPPIRKERKDSMRWLRFLKQRFGENTDVSASHVPAAPKIDWDYISTDDLDSDAKLKLFHYFVKEPQNRRLTNLESKLELSSVGESTASYFHCRCKVPVPAEHGNYIEAHGAATVKIEAELLCCMHAVRIIDALGLTLYYLSGMQNRHAEKVKAMGRWARRADEALPLPGKAITLPSPLRIDIVGPMPKAPEVPPVGCSKEVWEEYIPAAELFVKLLEEWNFNKCLHAGKVPRVGEKVIDLALDAVEPQPVDMHARTKLYNYCLVKSVEFLQPIFLQVGKRGDIYLCKMGVPGHAYLEGMGIGETRETALRRTSMHCLEILSRLEPSFSSLDLLSGAVKAASSAASVQMMEEGKNRLIDMYCVCKGSKGPTIETKVKQRGTMRTYTSQASVERHMGRGENPNRAAAEAQALSMLANSMMKAEPIFRDLASFLKSHPFLDVKHVVDLAIPPDVLQRITAITQKIEEKGNQVAKEEDDSKTDETTAEDEEEEVRKPRDLFAHITKSTPEAIGRASERLKKHLEDRECLPAYIQNFQPRRDSLPILAFRERLLDLLYVDKHSVVILCGTTGCGKTTQIPQYILEYEISQGRGGTTNILVTQPRRISAISIAQRIADERLQQIGEDVGYIVRLDARAGRHLTLVTSGVLLKIIKSNPNLDGVTHIIVDEIHERDINSDFLLILIRDLIKRRPELKVVLMSATLQARLFSEYFGGAPVLEAEGGVFPVQEHYIDDIAKIAEELDYSSPFLQALSNGEDIFTMEIDYNLLAFVIAHIEQTMGQDLVGHSILVFLPGWEEIIQTKNLLASGAGGNATKYQIIILHSTVSQADQVQCFAKAPGKIKIILSTNIAESGITIDDIKIVIDLGRMKEKSFVQTRGHTAAARDKTAAMSQLITVPASRANCVQRRGRAGRTQGGVCFRFYTREHFDALPDFQTPELLRQPLDSLCLAILHLQLGEPQAILSKALECPSFESVDHSMQRLGILGALSRGPKNETTLTPLGDALARLPMEPRIGKMVIYGMLFRCLDTTLTIAAAGDSDPFNNTKEMKEAAKKSRVRHLFGTNSDQLVCVNAYNSWVVRDPAEMPQYAPLEDGADDDDDTPDLPATLEEYEGANVLSRQALTQLSRYKKQFAEVLFKEILQVEMPNPQDRHSESESFVERSVLSQEAYNVPLVKAMLCTGLFPNVAIHKEKRKMFRSKFENALMVQTASVMNASKHFGTANSSPFVIFEEKVRVQTGLGADSKSFVLFRDGTQVSFWAMLLMGATADMIEYRDDVKVCLIDDWIPFRYDENEDTLNQVMNFKDAMNRIINRKLEKPKDKENNKLFLEVRKIVMELLAMPVRPNKISFQRWEEKGIILSSTEIQLNVQVPEEPAEEPVPATAPNAVPDEQLEVIVDNSMENPDDVDVGEENAKRELLQYLVECEVTSNTVRGDETVFKTTIIKGLYESTVTLLDDQRLCFEGRIRTSKLLAERSAAWEALKAIRENPKKYLGVDGPKERKTGKGRETTVDYNPFMLKPHEEGAKGLVTELLTNLKIKESLNNIVTYEDVEIPGEIYDGGKIFVSTISIVLPTKKIVHTGEKRTTKQQAQRSAALAAFYELNNNIATYVPGMEYAKMVLPDLAAPKVAIMTNRPSGLGHPEEPRTVFQGVSTYNQTAFRHPSGQTAASAQAPKVILEANVQLTFGAWGNKSEFVKYASRQVTDANGAIQFVAATFLLGHRYQVMIKGTRKAAEQASAASCLEDFMKNWKRKFSKADGSPMWSRTPTEEIDESEFLDQKLDPNAEAGGLANVDKAGKTLIEGFLVARKFTHEMMPKARVYGHVVFTIRKCNWFLGQVWLMGHVYRGTVLKNQVRPAENEAAAVAYADLRANTHKFFPPDGTYELNDPPADPFAKDKCTGCKADGVMGQVDITDLKFYCDKCWANVPRGSCMDCGAQDVCGRPDPQNIFYCSSCWKALDPSLANPSQVPTNPIPERNKNPKSAIQEFFSKQGMSSAMTASYITYEIVQRECNGPFFGTVTVLGHRHQCMEGHPKKKMAEAAVAEVALKDILANPTKYQWIMS